jgi:hypothetical protein
MYVFRVYLCVLFRRLVRRGGGEYGKAMNGLIGVCDV